MRGFYGRACVECRPRHASSVDNGPMRTEGFILQSSYRVESGRPVVRCFGVLENGETFLIRDDRAQPHLFVTADAHAAIRQLGLQRQVRPAINAAGAQVAGLQGEALLRIDVNLPTDAAALRDRLHAMGVRTFEADVRFAQAFLIDRGIRGSCLIEGPAEAGSDVRWTFETPLLSPADLTPQLKVLSHAEIPDTRTIQVTATIGATT